MLFRNQEPRDRRRNCQTDTPRVRLLDPRHQTRPTLKANCNPHTDSRAPQQSHRQAPRTTSTTQVVVTMIRRATARSSNTARRPPRPHARHRPTLAQHRLRPKHAEIGSIALARRVRATRRDAHALGQDEVLLAT